MAEYALLSIISMERNYHVVHASQAKRLWNKRFETNFVQHYSDSKKLSRDLLEYRCLNELTIGILGVGQMGKCAAKILKGRLNPIIKILRRLVSFNRIRL